MYKNIKKMSVAICIWAGIAVISILPAVVFWGISFDTEVYENFENPVMYRIVYLFFALLFTVPFVVFWLKTVQLMLINRLNDLLAADADGFVPISELSKAMGLTEAKMIKKATKAIRKGYLINCNYSMTQKAFLLSDKIGKPQQAHPGIPEDRPFIGVSCPCCAASLKIRANTQGTCPFCGQVILAPSYKGNQ